MLYSITAGTIALCARTGHLIDEYWQNPRNPRNRLGIASAMGNVENRSPTRALEKSSAAKQQKQKKYRSKERAAIVCVSVSSPLMNGFMMLDSGTTSQMSNTVSLLHNATECHIPIALGDDSEIRATHAGTCTVKWSSVDGYTDVHLSNTLVALTQRKVPVIVTPVPMGNTNVPTTVHQRTYWNLVICMWSLLEKSNHLRRGVQ